MSNFLQSKTSLFLTLLCMASAALLCTRAIPHSSSILRTANRAFSLLMTDSNSQKWLVASTCDDADAVRKITAALEGGDHGYAVTARQVHSYFHWGGKLDEADETRIEVQATSESGPAVAADIASTIKKDHTDDTPMIIENLGSAAEEPALSKPEDKKRLIRQITISGAADKVNREFAKKLVEGRVCGCAQLEEADGGNDLFCKTTVGREDALMAELKKAGVGGDGMWIMGNQGYVDWLRENCEEKA